MFVEVSAWMPSRSFSSPSVLVLPSTQSVKYAIQTPRKSRLTNFQVPNDDVLHIGQAEASLVDLTGSAHADDGLVVRDLELLAEGGHGDAAGYLDDILLRSRRVLLQVVVGGDRDLRPPVSSGGATV